MSAVVTEAAMSVACGSLGFVDTSEVIASEQRTTEQPILRSDRRRALEGDILRIGEVHSAALANMNAAMSTSLKNSVLKSVDTSWIQGLFSDGVLSGLGPSVAASLERVVPSMERDLLWVAGLTTTPLPRLDPAWVQSAFGDGALRGLGAAWSAAIVPPRVDMTWVADAQTSVLRGLSTSWLSAFDASRLVEALDGGRFAELLELLTNRYRHLPPNWWPVDIALDTRGDALRTLLLDEGIPLAWVPNAALVDRLLDADTAQQRRQLIRDGWRGIVRDCEDAAGSLSSRVARENARFIRRCASAIRDGHPEAAQALAANLIDTLGVQYVRKEVVGHNWRAIIAKNGRTTLTRLELRTLLVLGPVAVAHGAYRSGDVIPRAFTRHATAHAVSARQYSKTNSLLALMCATSLLCWLERDTEAFDNVE